MSSLRFILGHIGPETRVLDLGTASGEIANAVTEKGKEVIGIDHDHAMLLEGLGL